MRNTNLLRATTILAILTAVLAGPAAIRAQTELVEGPCTWTTRWKDIHGKCTTACCDSTQYSCPCSA